MQRQACTVSKCVLCLTVGAVLLLLLLLLFIGALLQVPRCAPPGWCSSWRQQGARKLTAAATAAAALPLLTQARISVTFAMLRCFICV